MKQVEKFKIYATILIFVFNMQVTDSSKNNPNFQNIHQPSFQSRKFKPFESTSFHSNPTGLTRSRRQSHPAPDMCTTLKRKPEQFHVDTSESLLDLLNAGSTKMYSQKSYEAGILLLGRMNTDKIALAKILTGDIDNLDVVRLPDSQKIINGIKVHKGIDTIIPHYFSKDPANEGNLTIIECPTFTDNRNLNQQIAEIFFIRTLFLKVSKVKILFVVYHTTVKDGQDHKDFKKFVKFAISFLKNIPKYIDSIGLLVIRVDVSSKNNDIVTNALVLGDIVSFLNEFENKVAETPEEKEFTRSLTQKNDKGGYDHIALFRTPTQCGPLNESNEVAQAKEDIDKLYSKTLKFTPVQDYIYNLTNSSYKSVLKDLSFHLNQNVSDEIMNISSNFIEFFIQTYSDLHNSTLFIQNLKALNDSFFDINNSKNFKTLVTRLFKTLTEMNFTFSNEMMLKYHSQYLEFEETVNSIPDMNFAKYWKYPVKLISFFVDQIIDFTTMLLEEQENVAFLQNNLDEIQNSLKNRNATYQSKKETAHAVELSEREIVKDKYSYIMNTKDEILAYAQERKCDIFSPKKNIEFNTKGLFLACADANVDAIKVFIGLGAVVNATKQKPNVTVCPLNIVAASKNATVAIQMVKLLIEKGADNYRCSNCSTYDNFLQILLQQYKPITPDQFNELAMFLVSKGATFLYLKEHNNPLFLAVKNIEVRNDTLWFLKRSGVAFHFLEDYDGNTLLHAATYNNRSSEFLVNMQKLGIDFKKKNGLGETVLHLAAANTNLGAVKYFLDLKMDIDEKTLEGNTALMLAVQKKGGNTIEVVKFLVAKGANKYLKNKSEKTALDLADHQPDNVKNLLSKNN